MPNAKGRRGLAIYPSVDSAVPGVIYALFVLPIVIAQPRWN